MNGSDGSHPTPPSEPGRSTRRAWQTPEIESLGPLRALVRAIGKTGPNDDLDPHDRRKAGTG
jgi:hypothetical protein